MSASLNKTNINTEDPILLGLYVRTAQLMTIE